MSLSITIDNFSYMSEFCWLIQEPNILVMIHFPSPSKLTCSYFPLISGRFLTLIVCESIKGHWIKIRCISFTCHSREKSKSTFVNNMYSPKRLTVCPSLSLSCFSAASPLIANCQRDLLDKLKEHDADRSMPSVLISSMSCLKHS